MTKQETATDHRLSATEAASVQFENFGLLLHHRPLIERLDLELKPGGTTLILGPSGGGKSSLLRALAGLIQPWDGVFNLSGRILIGGRAVKPGRVSAGVGVVFQQYALFDQWSALDNVRFAIDHRSRVSRGGSVDAVAEARTLLEELDVPHDRKPSQLSGGQQQRLAIARTLGQRPTLVLFDEPTSGLDLATARRVTRLLAATKENHPHTAIIVTHDERCLPDLADRIFLLDPRKRTLVEQNGRSPADTGSDRADETVEIKALDDVTALSDDSANASPSEAAPVEAGLSGKPETDSPRASETSPRDDRPMTEGSAAESRSLPEKLARILAEAAYSTTRIIAELLAVLPALLPLWRCPRWGLRLVWDQLKLVGGPSAWVYLAVVGGILGFVATDFTFRFLPYAEVTDPLLRETLLEGMGFAIFRTLIPLFATVLIAARCGAAAAQDIGQRTYSRQLDALAVLHAPPRRYLLTATLLAFLIATPILLVLSFETARLVSMIVFLVNNPDLDPWFWRLHFHQSIRLPGRFFLEGTGWVISKTLCSALGVAAIAYRFGASPKDSSRAVGRSITSTILWATLFVLLVQVVFAFFEY